MINANCYKSYMKFMNEHDRTSYDQLDTFDKEELTSYKIKETPIESMPKLEEFDPNRNIMILLSRWIEDNDEITGIEILEHLRECAIKAFKPVIEKDMKEYEPEYPAYDEYDEYRIAM